MLYIIAVHVPIAGLALLPVLFGWGPLLGPIQIVFMELVIDPASSIVLELEPAPRDIMRRPPRPRGASVLDARRVGWSLAQGAALLVSVLGMVALLRDGGHTTTEVRTLAFVALVVGNLALLLASRSAEESLLRTLRRKNRAVPILVAATLAGLALITLVPPIANALGLGVSLGVGVLAALGFGLAPIIALDVIEAVVARRREARSLGAT